MDENHRGTLPIIFLYICLKLGKLFFSNMEAFHSIFECVMYVMAVSEI